MGDFDYSTHYRYAALMLCPLALFGFTCNLIVVLFIRKMPSLTNSFGNLTLSQALADTCHQAIFAFYFAPCLLLHNYEVYTWSSEFGFILLVCYDICGFSHVSISINRFTALYAPMTYSRIFSNMVTRILICVYWIISAALSVYLIKILDCPFYLPQGQWNFIFKISSTCSHVQMFDFAKYIVFVGIVACLDCSSILRLHFVNRRNASTMQDSVSIQRRRQEKNLVYQAALQGIFFISELITYFILPPIARNKWELFLLMTMSWCAVHAMDGFIVLSFNRDFRRLIRETMCCAAHQAEQVEFASRANPRSNTAATFINP